MNALLTVLMVVAAPVPPLYAPLSGSPSLLKRPDVSADDLWRFPPRWLVLKQLEWYGGRMEWLTTRRDCYTTGTKEWLQWDFILDDARARAKAWTLLEEACQFMIEPDPSKFQTSPKVWTSWREQAENRLKGLQDLIGPDAYRLGQMPGPASPLFYWP